METFRFYPPQLQSKQLPYEVLVTGVADCQHQLLDDGWPSRISVHDGVVFATYSCKHCGRQVYQSLDEVLPPATWGPNGG